MAWRFLALVLLFITCASWLVAGDTRMNPDLSISGLFSASDKTGLNVDEIELQAVSDIDPYLHGNVMLSFSPDAAGDFGVNVEEAYVETLALPLVTLKAGKFKAALGKQNTLHTHAFPFIDAPLASQALLGDEGLDDVGLSAALLIPAPWFMEVTAQALNSRNPDLFNDPNREALDGIGSLKNLWDLSENTTLELILSAVGGRNATDDISQVENAELTLKWRANETKALIFGTQWMRRDVEFTGGDDLKAGLSAWLQAQVARRWWLEARSEGLSSADSSDIQTLKESALIAYLPTEFSGLRLQYDWTKAVGVDADHRVTLQLNIAMGVHPAHGY